jgi:hypothetical protein
MIDTVSLRESLCKTFCADLSVKQLPSGIAVTTTLRDAVSDPIACFIERENNGWFMADDGQFLADTVARGIDIATGSRKDFLDRILRPVGAWCDLTNYEIRTETLETVPTPETILSFVTALARARDVTFWSRERIKSTFKDDAYKAIVDRLGERAEIQRSAPVDKTLAEFPADAIVRPVASAATHAPVTAVFFVQALDTLNEALMLWMEARQLHRPVRIAALVEDGTINLSSYKAQRTFNRIDTTAFFRGDEAAAIDRIEQLAFRAA